MFYIYLAEMADNINSLFFISSMLLGFGMLITFIHEALVEDRLYKPSNTLKVLFVISVIMACITPSTNQIYRIIGIGKTLEFVQNSDNAKEIPENTLKLINTSLKKLNETLDEQP